MLILTIVAIACIIVIQFTTGFKKTMLFFPLLLSIIVLALIFLKPPDLFFLIGLALILAIVAAVISFLFRKRKKSARLLVSVIVWGYVLFFALYPSIRSYMHAERYDQLAHYLQQTYPTEQFTIEFREYKYVIQFGDFDVSNQKTPNSGVTYRVQNDGEIIQLSGSWQKNP